MSTTADGHRPQRDLTDHARWLRRLARALVRDGADADDVVQETWLAYLRRPPLPGSALRPWLATVLRNFVKMRGRAAAADARRVENAARADAPQALPSTEVLLDRHASLRRLAQLVSELDEPYRSTVLLWSQEGLSPKEIAERQALPAGTVRWRLKQGLDELRRRMDADHDGDRRAWVVLLEPVARLDAPAPGAAAAITKGILVMKTSTKVVSAVALIALLLLLGWKLLAPGRPGDTVAAAEGARAASVASRRAERTASAPSAGDGDDAGGTPAAGGHLLHGFVRDSGGGVVAGARVVAATRDAAGVRQHTATSDRGGQYVIALPTGEYEVAFRAEGYATTRLERLPISANMSRDVRLHPAARAAGRVIQRGTGEAVEGAEVRLAGQRGILSAVTDGGGAFAFTNVEAGVYVLSARKGGLAGRRELSLAVAASVPDAIVELAPGAVLTGRVLASSGRPVPRATVDIPGTEPATTDDRGAFRVEGLLAGSVSLTTRAPGFAADHRTIVLRGAQATADITLAGGATLEGRIVTADGTPVAGVAVDAFLERLAEQRVYDASGVTGPDGTFRFTDLPAGKAVLRADHPQHGFAQADVAGLREGETARAELRLEPAAFVTGRVRFQDGAAAAGVVVRGFMRRGTMMERSGSTDERGAFRLGPFAAGTVRLLASRSEVVRYPDHIITGPNEKNVVVSRGDADGGVLTLPRGEGRSIAGIVLDPDGAPSGGTLVRAIEQTAGALKRLAEAPEAISDDDGRFVIQGATGSRYNLVAQQPGHPETVVAGIAAGSTGVEIRLQRYGSVSGRVERADGKPLSTFTVGAVWAEIPGAPSDRNLRQDFKVQARETFSGGDGAFTLRNLPIETYDLLVTTPDGAVGRAGPVPVAAGDDTRGVRIVLAAGARVRGRILEYGTGRALPGVQAVVLLPERTITADTEADGAFVLSGVPRAQRVKIRFRTPRTHIDDSQFVQIPDGVDELDAGVSRLIPGQPVSRNASTGARFSHEGTHVVVAAVQTVSPAASAGLRPGDHLLSIDGKDVAGLGQEGVRTLNAGEPQQPVTYVVRTASGEVRTARLVRVPYDSIVP